MKNKLLFLILSCIITNLNCAETSHTFKCHGRIHRHCNIWYITCNYGNIYASSSTNVDLDPNRFKAVYHSEKGTFTLKINEIQVGGVYPWVDIVAFEKEKDEGWGICTIQ